MPKVISVERLVPLHLRDSSNYPHQEICDYSLEDVCKQGFLASMVDEEHFIIVKQKDVVDI